MRFSTTKKQKKLPKDLHKELNPKKMKNFTDGFLWGFEQKKTKKLPKDLQGIEEEKNEK